MSRPLIIKCDVCEATSSPRWLQAIVRKELGGSVLIGPNLVPPHELKMLDLCGESCAIKLISQTLGAGNGH